MSRDRNRQRAFHSLPVRPAQHGLPLWSEGNRNGSDREGAGWGQNRPCASSSHTPCVIVVYGMEQERCVWIISCLVATKV
jgi:hypothetical protein